MNEVKKTFENWLDNVTEVELLQELKNIEEFPEEINERFYKDLKFGTAGLRGVMGVGTNMMNIYTVRKTSQGLANYLKEQYDRPVVVVSYDSRKNSKIFAMETAKVMAGNKIKSYITEKIQPTPFLSFSVREIYANAGVMITASHNPAEYNGYKCYGKDGAQMGEAEAQKVYEKMCEIDTFEDIKIMEFENAKACNLISFVSESIYESYFNCVMKQRINNNSLEGLKVVYTPLNGAGNYFVQKVLKVCGLKDLYVVSCQEQPDENFTTCPYPNPESSDAYTCAKKLAISKNADIILATDPDSDRVGICIKCDDDYTLLTGNEIGVLLCNYLLLQKSKSGTLPKNSMIVRSIVSTPMVDEIASVYGCQVREVLTGFKNIASEILKLELCNEESRFIMGFEESNGYLVGTYARDKDAVSAVLLLSEMALYYKNKGLTLLEVLNNLKQRYGFFAEKTLNFEFKGSLGRSRIENIMNNLRNFPFEYFKDRKILKVKDYFNSKIFDGLGNCVNEKNLPISNVLIFYFDEGAKLVIRPSGTEPKIKFYAMVKGNSLKNSELKINDLTTMVNNLIENVK